MRLSRTMDHDRGQGGESTTVEERVPFVESDQDERRLKSQYLSTFTDSTLEHLLIVP